MTPNNFRWFLHALLYIHTQRVIQRQMAKAESGNDEDEDIDGIDIDEED
jgi:hypothetical protein